MTSVPPVPAIDLGALSAACIPLGAAAALDLARRHWGLDGTLRQFETEKDDTFRLDADDGRQFVFKIANPAETRDELDLQVAALRHIHAVAPDLPVPQIVPAVQGEFLVPVPSAQGVRLARMMTFLPGTVLDTVRPTPAEQEQIGRTGARLRHALAGFSHPGAERKIAWDVRNLPDLEPLLAQVADPAQRRILTQAFARFMAVRPRVNALRRQVLHNDFNRSNLLLDRSSGARIAGIIDFGDIVRTAIAIDMSTAMLNQLPREDEPAEDMFAGPMAVLHGYRVEADLTPEELSLLPFLVMGRVVVRALVSLWRAAQFPENQRYILRNTRQGWAQLDWFMTRSPEQLAALIR